MKCHDQSPGDGISLSHSLINLHSGVGQQRWAEDRLQTSPHFLSQQKLYWAEVTSMQQIPGSQKGSQFRIADVWWDLPVSITVSPWIQRLLWEEESAAPGCPQPWCSYPGLAQGASEAVLGSWRHPLRSSCVLSHQDWPWTERGSLSLCWHIIPSAFLNCSPSRLLQTGFLNVPHLGWQCTTGHLDVHEGQHSLPFLFLGVFPLPLDPVCFHGFLFLSSFLILRNVLSFLSWHMK